ncbi:MAG: leucine-rich repeat protein, partial [Atopobiaceae bacterium]|nr:leucine-rich repeat protein [Atopobiaceae bacterium]
MNGTVFRKTLKIAVSIILIIEACCLGGGVALADSESGTTTGYRYPEAVFNNSLSRFPSLATLSSGGTIPIPGLEVTKGLHKDDNGDLASFYASNSGMIPQGITIANGYIVISAYDAEYPDPSVPSVLYVKALSASDDSWTTVSLYEMDKGVFFSPSSGSYPGNKESINHVGGLASDDQGNLYVAKSGNRTVARITFERLQQAASAGGSVAMSYDAELPVNTTASFLTWYSNKLWVGVCTSGGKGILTGYSIGEEADGILAIEEKMSCAIDGKANGAAFASVNGHECLALNVSHGRNSSKAGYVSEMRLYEANLTEDSIDISQKNKLTLPPMAEEIAVAPDGRMYALFESAAKKYSAKEDDKCDYIVDRVCVTTTGEVFKWTDPKYGFTELTQTHSGGGAQFVSCTISTSLHGPNDPDAVREVDVTYRDGDGTDRNTGFLYSDEMMFRSSIHSDGKPDTDFAKMSVALAASAYSSDYIERAMLDMGCNQVSLYNYGREATYEDNDFVGFCVGSKRVFTETDAYTLYFVAVRGTPKSGEWLSDFNLGTTGNHAGFYAAESEVIDVLREDFFALDGSDAAHRKVLTTGHSRGAAVSNILAAHLSQGSYVDAGNVFGYTFACPSVSKTANASMDNIYNYNYAGDLVPVLPLEAWGYGRNGHTYPLVMDDNACFQFRRVFEENFAGAGETDDAIRAIKDLIKTEQDYLTVRPALDLAACMLGGMDMGTKLKVLRNAPIEMSAQLMNRLVESAGDEELPVVADGYKGECTTLLEQVNAGIDDIDERLDNAEGDASEAHRIWNDWCTDNQRMLEDIVDLTGISVSQRSDFDDVTSFLERQSQIERYTILATWQDIIACFCRTQCNPVAAIAHGHKQGTYVVGINTMYYGWEGWYGSEVLAAFPDSDEYGTIKSVGARCFYGCSKLKALTMPEGGLDSVGYSAFAGLSTLSVIDGGMRINKYVGAYAFEGCAGISSLSVGDGVASLPAGAFRGCSGIRELALPVSLAYDR